MQARLDQAADQPPELRRDSTSFARRVLALLGRHPGLLWKQLREEYRNRWGILQEQRRGDGFSAAPVKLNLNLTWNCYLKCRMCPQYRYSPESPEALSWYNPKRELPLTAWTGLFDQVASYRPWLYLTGGEPTLYRDFANLVREAKKRKLPVHLQTNGTHLAEQAELLVTQGVELVTVSLDGPAEIHNLIRGGDGVFRRASAGIAALLATRQRLQEPGPLLILNCTISKANLASLNQMTPLALELGADLLQLQHTMFNSPDQVSRHNRLVSPRWAQAHGLDLVFPSILAGEFYESEIGPEDLPLLKERLGQVIKTAQGRLKLAFLPNLSLDELDSYYLDLRYPRLQLCKFLWKGCPILPDGTVSPCLHVTAGKITEAPLQEIWNGARMRNFRRVITPGLLPGCVRCCKRSYH